jgi:hypothetical protein
MAGFSKLSFSAILLILLFPFESKQHAINNGKSYQVLEDKVGMIEVPILQG